MNAPTYICRLEIGVQKVGDITYTQAIISGEAPTAEQAVKLLADAYAEYRAATEIKIHFAPFVGEYGEMQPAK